MLIMNLYKVDKLILKLIDNSISEEESKRLQSWLEDSENLKYFNDYIEVNQLINSKKEFDHRSSLNEFVEKSQINKNKRLKRKLFYAAASVVVFISIAFLIKNNNETNVNTTVIANYDDIKIGTDKATLTLEDGSSVALGKGQVYKTGKVASNGEQIVYNNAESETIVYNYLTVPRGGQFEITLADGTQVWLNSESKLKYPVAFKEGVSRQVELVYGEAYFDVSPSEKHHGSTFKVVSHLQEVEVLGTEFNIKAYRDDAHVYTTLVEGKVVVNNEVFKEKLSVNEQSVLSDVRGAIAISTVNVYNETAWRKGVFSFRNKDLKEIMKALSRWYDVDIVFENKKLETIQFNGVLSKNMTLEEILNPIKRNINLNYKVYDNKIILQ